MDRDGDNQISFVEFMLAATRLLYIDNSDGGCGIAVKLAQAEECVMEATERRGTGGANLGGTATLPRSGPAQVRARSTPEEEFDHMLVSVRRWSDQIEERRGNSAEPRELGRIERVLHGSIVGSKNDHIVKALRLCYTQYKPLRLMGDLIFNLMGRVMERA
jgi:hypothetical protein